MAFALLGIVSEFVAEDTVYKMLIYLIGGCNVFMYTVICICQYRFRKRFYAEGGKDEDLKYRVPYPITPILGVIGYLAVLVMSLMDPGEAVTFYICIPIYAVIYIAAYFYTKKKGVKAVNIDM